MTGRAAMYDDAALSAVSDYVFVLDWGLHWTTSAPGGMDELPWFKRVAEYTADAAEQEQVRARHADVRDRLAERRRRRQPGHAAGVQRNHRARERVRGRSANGNRWPPTRTSPTPTRTACRTACGTATSSRSKCAWRSPNRSAWAWACGIWVARTRRSGNCRGSGVRRLREPTGRGRRAARRATASRPRGLRRRGGAAAASVAGAQPPAASPAGAFGAHVGRRRPAAGRRRCRPSCWRAPPDSLADLRSPRGGDRRGVPDVLRMRGRRSGTIGGGRRRRSHAYANAHQIAVMPRFNCQEGADGASDPDRTAGRARTLAQPGEDRREPGYAGVNLDLENDGAADRAALSSFVQRSRASCTRTARADGRCRRGHP